MDVIRSELIEKKELMNVRHPMSRFHYGNKKTLIDKPESLGKNVTLAMHDWFKFYYQVSYEKFKHLLHLAHHAHILGNKTQQSNPYLIVSPSLIEDKTSYFRHVRASHCHKWRETLHPTQTPSLKLC